MSSTLCQLGPHWVLPTTIKTSFKFHGSDKCEKQVVAMRHPRPNMVAKQQYHLASYGPCLPPRESFNGVSTVNQVRLEFIRGFP